MNSCKQTIQAKFKKTLSIPVAISTEAPQALATIKHTNPIGPTNTHTHTH